MKTPVDLLTPDLVQKMLLSDPHEMYAVILAERRDQFGIRAATAEAIGMATVALWMQRGARLVEVSEAVLTELSNHPPRLHAAVEADVGVVGFIRARGDGSILLSAPNHLGHMIVVLWLCDGNRWRFIVDELTPFTTTSGTSSFHQCYDAPREAEYIVRVATTAYAAVAHVAALPPSEPKHRPRRRERRERGPHVQRLTLDPSMLLAWRRTVQQPPRVVEAAVERAPVAMHAVADHTRRMWVLDPGDAEPEDIREGKGGYLYLVRRPVRGYVQGAGMPCVKRSRLVMGPEDLR